MSLELAILIIIVIWLLVLSITLFWIFSNFRRLTREVKKGNLIKVLDKVLATEAKNVRDLAQLEKEIKKLDEEATLHVQKVGLVRFNPFNELGGDHSFSLALLNGKETGVILTGLHTRERTRVYMKRIKRGKSTYDLSSEEKKALDKARKGK